MALMVINKCQLIKSIHSVNDEKRLIAAEGDQIFQWTKRNGDDCLIEK